jgi:PAS domain S-box-containing protein
MVEPGDPITLRKAPADTPHTACVHDPTSDTQAVKRRWHGVLRGFGITAALAAAVTLGLWLTQPWSELQFVAPAFVLASAAAAWLGGYWVGAATVLVAYLIAGYLFPGPHEPFALWSFPQLLVHLIFSAIAIMFGGAARSMQQHAQAAIARLKGELGERARTEALRAMGEHRARDEAQRVQRQLQERVEELEKLMDLIPIGLYLAHDAQCHRITGNRAAGELLSTDPRSNLSSSAPHDQHLVRRHRVLQNGRELAVHEFPLQRAAAQGVAVSGDEYQVVFEDGSVKYVYGYASPLFDAQGKVRGALAALLDVTPRKRAQAELEEVHARISSILETITDAFCALDRDWRYTYINRQAEQYYGRDKRSLLGQNIWEVFPQLITTETYRQLHHALRENVPVHFEVNSPTMRRWVEVHAYPGPQGMSVFFRDIEARKRSATEVERLNRELNSRIGELETLLELLPVGVWIGNASCNRLVGNRAAYQILGLPFGINASLTSPDARHPPLSQLRFTIDGQPAAPTALPMHKTARSGVACENIEYEVTRSDGTRRIVYGSAAPLFDEDGRVRAVIGAHTDVTERKHTELALREAHRQKDEFLATLAHELRNPLNPIRSALAVLRLQYQVQPGSPWPGEVIDRQVRQMARLLDDLLDVSRLTLNRLELRRSTALLVDVVSLAVETSRPLIEAAAHRLDIELPAQPVYVDADVTRLAQVFSNLLNNAAKYTDPGGRIALSAKLEEGHARVVVEDTGIGIAPERLAQVFDMFSQEQPALDRSHSGLGIGLALSRALVQLHGGSLEAASEGRGRGSRFTVILPVTMPPAEAAHASASVHAAQPAADGMGKHVLVVDDNRDSAESLAMYLELMGHTVSTAFDGEQAITTVQAKRPEVVLLDIGLPGQNGYEIARKIRETAGGREILLVAITGWGQEEDKRRAREAGFDLHLTKPVDPHAIADLLQTPSAQPAH